MPAYVGVDWSENEQDWYAIGADGAHLGHGIVRETRADLDGLDARLRSLADPKTGELPVVGIETGRGLLVTTLRQRGYTVYSINPLRVARYRERYGQSRTKSDQADARLIADILRTDGHRLRPLPDTSDAADAIALLARAQQNEVWRINSIVLETRSLLRQYFPAALTIWPASSLTQNSARAVLMAAPTPTAARALTKAQLRRILLKAGRTRDIDANIADWMRIFAAPTLTQPPLQEAAFGAAVQTLLHSLNGAIDAQKAAEVPLVDAVQDHPLYAILGPIKGLGDITAGRLLGEIGDDPTRFETADGLRSFAGTAPMTRDSGNRRLVARRIVKSNRLQQAAWMWAFCSLKPVPGAKAYYDLRRSNRPGSQGPDGHAAALRNMSNRMLGGLWHCMTTGELWDNDAIWGPVAKANPVKAASVSDEAQEVTSDDELEAAIEAINALGDPDAIDDEAGSRSA